MSMNNLGLNAVDTSSIVLTASRRVFGGMIQGARETAGRSVEEAARLAAMEPSEWLAVEAGQIAVDPSWLHPMADALEVPFGQMTALVHLCQFSWPE
jgi:hypothetical protein